jgi:hypothetical protein
MTAASRADLTPGGLLVLRNAALDNAFTYTQWDAVSAQWEGGGG